MDLFRRFKKHIKGYGTFTMRLSAAGYGMDDKDILEQTRYNPVPLAANKDGNSRTRMTGAGAVQPGEISAWPLTTWCVTAQHWRPILEPGVARGVPPSQGTMDYVEEGEQRMSRTRIWIVGTSQYTADDMEREILIDDK
nr:hypothetical protein L204_03433 [Cryptococcus depauperatus CBS 7855]